jgi:hypothetical protein
VALIIQKIFKTFHQVLLSVKSYKDRVDELINKLKEVHGDFYSYEFINYKGSRLPITITCPYHGNFEQRCDVHLKGSGVNLEVNLANPEMYRHKTRRLLSNKGYLTMMLRITCDLACKSMAVRGCDLST